MNSRWLDRSGFVLLFILGAFSALPGQEFAILFTNSSNGTIENCQCPDQPLGALEKRAQFIAEYRRDHPGVLIVDNGDNFIDFHSPEVEAIITAAMRICGYDIINLGDQDLAYAPAEYLLLGAVAEHQYQVRIEKDGVRFSILPILHPGTTRFYPEGVFTGYNLQEPDQAIQQWLQQTEEPDIFRILLSHSGFETDQELARRFPSIDLIISGHSQTVLDTLVVIAGVPIVQAGGDAAYVGEIRFIPDLQGYRSTQYTLHPLLIELPDHPMIRAMIDSMKQSSNHH